jgi:hypothetical protein
MSTVHTGSVVYPHHFYADPDPAFGFNADPDPAPHQSDENLRPLVYRPFGIHFKPPRLHCERPRPFTPHFEPLKPLHFDLNADLDPDSASRNNSDPYGPALQPCTRHRVHIIPCMQCCGTGMFIPDPESEFFHPGSRILERKDPGSGKKNLKSRYI